MHERTLGELKKMKEGCQGGRGLLRVAFVMAVLLMWTCLCVACFLILSDDVTRGQFIGAISCFTIWMVGGWFCIKATVGKSCLLEPGVTGGAMLALLFGIRPFLMVMAGETQYYKWFYIGDALAGAVELGAVATGVFLLSYELGRSGRYERRERHNARKPKRWPENWSMLYLYVGILAISSLVLFMLQLHLYGGVLYGAEMLLSGQKTQLVSGAIARSEYLSVAPILSACGAALLIAANGGVMKRFRLKVYITILVLFPVIVFLLEGERRFLIPAVGVPVVSYYLAARKQLPLKLIMLTAPAVLMILISGQFIRNPPAWERVGGFVGFPGYVVSHLDELAETVFLRSDTEMVSVLALEMKSLQSGGWYYGAATVGDLLLAPIPSSVFPGKPMTARNEMLVQLFGMPCTPEQGGMCPDFSAPGTFYQDAGWLGTIIGMFAMGWVSGRIWRRYLRSGAGLFAVCVASSWTVLLPIILRAGFMPGFSWFLFLLFPIMIGVVLLRLPKPSE